MANCRINEAAEEDIARLYLYGVRRFGLTQADVYYEGLINRIEAIGENPSLYPAVNDLRPGYRRSIYGAHAIYFRTADGVVEIMRVLGRENPGTALAKGQS